MEAGIAEETGWRARVSEALQSLHSLNHFGPGSLAVSAILS